MTRVVESPRLPQEWNAGVMTRVIKRLEDAIGDGSGGGDITVQEEGVALTTAATTLNFTGNGVTTTGTGATKTIDIPNLTGFRNKLINGNFEIWQRGTTAVTASGAYSADRWVQLWQVSGLSTTRGTFVSGDALFDPTGTNAAATYFVTIAVTAGTNAAHFSYFFQKIEDVKLLAGKTVTVSFWAKAASAATIGVSLQQNFGTGGSGDVNGNGQSQAITTSWTKYTKTFTLNTLNGKTLGPSNTSSTSVFFWLDAGSTYDTLSGTIGQSNKTVSLAQIQLEIGAATDFEVRPLTLETYLCYRYYWRMTPSGSATVNMLGVQRGTVEMDFALMLPVPMRTTPTVVASGASWSTTTFTSNDLGAYDPVAAGYVTSSWTLVTLTIANGRVSDQQALLRFTGSGGGGAFGGAAGRVVEYTMGTTHWAAFDAEL